MMSGRLPDGRTVDLTSGVVAGREGNRLKFTTTGTLMEATVVAGGSEMGWSGPFSERGTIVGEKTVLDTFTGVLTEDLELTITLNGGSDYTLSLAAAAAVDNSNIFDLRNQLNAALGEILEADGRPARLDHFLRFDIQVVGANIVRYALSIRTDQLEIVDRTDVLRIVGSRDAPLTGILSGDTHFTLVVGASGEPVNVLVPLAASR